VIKRPTREQQKAIVKQWTQAGPELAGVRREELKNWQYDWRTVDALLDAGTRGARSRNTSGLVELQEWLKKLPGS